MKSELREASAGRRAAAFGGHPLAGLTMAAWAPAPWFAPGVTVSAYWPYRSEIDPRPLMRRFAQAGARLLLPVAPARGSAAALQFRLWSLGDALQNSPFGVREPGPDAPALDPEILLIPLLAFDRAGGRLGYGAGHYDRTLQRLRKLNTVLAVGLAFAAQEIDAVPMDLHDQRLDAILTERGVIAVDRAKVY